MLMIPENVTSILIVGENLESVLFKCAVNYAESGNPVWIYTPRQIKQLPKNIDILDKQVLKLLTFLYLKDTTELLGHLNGVHLWHKTPKITIVTSFEEYCNFSSPDYNALFTASFILANLYDALKVFNNVQGGNERNYLLITCKVPSEHESKLEALASLYFPNIYTHTDSIDETLCYINKIFLNS